MPDETNDSDLFDFMKDDLEILPDIRIDAVRQLEKNSLMVSRLLHLADSIVVEDDETCKKALDISGEARSINKAIEEFRKKATEPHRKVTQAINDCAKEFQVKLDEADRCIKIKLAEWHRTQQIQAEKAQESVKKLSESLGLGVEIIAPNAPKTLSSGKASASLKDKLTFEIEDPNLVPDEYWVIDDTLIKKHIALGKREIPGVKITTEKTMIIRRK